jgi:hypothetical protein
VLPGAPALGDAIFALIGRRPIRAEDLRRA